MSLWQRFKHFFSKKKKKKTSQTIDQFNWASLSNRSSKSASSYLQHSPQQYSNPSELNFRVKKNEFI